jgi:tetratricopeptide (TPR) repeat protein
MKKRNILLFIVLFILIHSLFAGNDQKTDSLLKVIRTAKDTALVNTYLALADIYKNKDFDSALNYIVRAEKEAEKINYKKGYGEALLIHGNILYFNNEYSEGLNYFTKSLNIAKESDDNLLKARSLERLASLHLMTDDPNLALKLYYESLSLFEKLDDRKGIAKVYNILGIYKADKGEFDTALSYLDKSIRIHQELNDTHNLIENKVNMGYVYEQAGESERAERIYLETIPLIRETGELSALAVVYFNLSSIHQSRNENREGLQYIQKATEIAEQLNDTSLLASLYGNAGELLIKEKQWNQAGDQLNKSVLCSRAIDDVETEIHALKLVAYLDSITGDFNSALLVTKHISILKDTLYKHRLEHTLQESELRYENHKHQELIELQGKIIRKNEAIKVLFIVLFFIVSVALLLLVRLFVIQRKSHVKSKKLHEQQLRLKQLDLEQVQHEERIQKLEKERIEESLRLKEREVVSLALQMERTNENFTFIRKKIKELTENRNVKIEELIKLEKELKARSHDFDSWELFYKSFNEIHKDFFKTLKSRHPDLTTTELKHCAYIRINLSANQMSTLLNVTIEAIRKTRYRIRKKMNLSPDNSLENYLLRF